MKLLNITITNEHGPKQYLLKVADSIPPAFRFCFQRIGLMLLATIQRNLSGKVLNQRSGKLIRSAHTDIEENKAGFTVVVSVGAGAPYGRVHEFGGTFTVPAHMSASRTGKIISVKQYQVTYPERSFARSAVDENKTAILKAIEQTVESVLTK